MDGLAVLGTAVGVNTLALSVVLFAVKKIVTTACNGIQKNIDAEKDERVAIDNELWSAVNSHGHKGLNENDARVTR